MSASLKCHLNRQLTKCWNRAIISVELIRDTRIHKNHPALIGFIHAPIDTTTKEQWACTLIEKQSLND